MALDSLSEAVLELRSGRQVRAARVMLGWEQADLAREAEISVPTVHRMETLGVERCSLTTLLKVQRVLHTAGVSFPAQDAGREIGVRMRVKQ